MQPSSAHLRSLRDAAGFSATAASEYFGVPVRTWRYWESPKCTDEIKPDVLAELNTLSGLVADAVDRMTDSALALYETLEDEPDTVTITRYRTQADLDQQHPGFPGGVLTYSRVVSLVVARLKAHGVPVVTVWDDVTGSEASVK